MQEEEKKLQMANIYWTTSVHYTILLIILF